MGKYTAEEIWELACEPDIDLEFERVMKMTDAEVRASLASRGYDLMELEGRAKRLFGLPRRRKTRGFIAGGVALAAALAPLAAILADFGPAVPVVLATAASVPPLTPEEVLRKAAFEACAAHDWESCLAKLDQARALDPYGETRGEVIDAREEATSHMKGGDR